MVDLSGRLRQRAKETVERYDRAYPEEGLCTYDDRAHIREISGAELSELQAQAIEQAHREARGDSRF